MLNKAIPKNKVIIITMFPIVNFPAKFASQTLLFKVYPVLHPPQTVALVQLVHSFAQLTQVGVAKILVAFAVVFAAGVVAAVFETY